MENKFKIFVIVAIVLLAAGIAGSTFFVLSTINNKQVATEESVSLEENYDLVAVALGEAITANVYEEAGKQHIARIQVSFGADQSDKKAYTAFTEKYNASLAIVRNELIQIIREQTYSMMIQPDAQASLSDEIAARVNAILDTNVIKEVYFEDFFIQ